MSSLNTEPVHKAVMKHSLPDVIEAIALGGSVDELDREGRTPLFYAARDGDSSIVAELIRLGANVNARDKNLETALHFAARAYQPELIRLLLSKGANVNAQDAFGNTALSRAVFDSKGRGEVIKALLLLGAKKDLQNKNGISPEHIAKSIGNYDVEKFFAD